MNYAIAIIIGAVVTLTFLHQRHTIRRQRRDIERLNYEVFYADMRLAVKESEQYAERMAKRRAG